MRRLRQLEEENFRLKRMVTASRLRIREIAVSRVCYGDQRIYVLLRREVWMLSRKRGHRLCREEGLNLRHIKRSRRHLNAFAKPRRYRRRIPMDAGPWTLYPIR